MVCHTVSLVSAAITVPRALSLVIALVFLRVSKDSLCWSSQVRPGTMTGGCIHRPSACVLMKIKLTYWKSYSDQRLPLIFPELGQVIFPGNLFLHGQEGREEGIIISFQTLRCQWSPAKASETSFQCFPLLRLLTTVSGRPLHSVNRPMHSTQPQTSNSIYCACLLSIYNTVALSLYSCTNYF